MQLTQQKEKQKRVIKQKTMTTKTTKAINYEKFDPVKWFKHFFYERNAIHLLMALTLNRNANGPAKSMLS